ncbi:MAG: TetR/AcrR family transcriptional regulator [Spirochaetia bacterium]|nr:TetR/AcrR family transcriptional regulator [Spirochaetia bacterium]MCE1209682.1 TetR/AcrR family transcriptional regulator [Spirochaetia bacterium]
MNTVVTSREEIIAATRALAAKGHIADIGIRAVAKASGIAVGSVYYYFPSKDELIAALVEDIWRSILSSPPRPNKKADFIGAVEDFCRRVKKGSSDFPSFFALHTLSFSKADKYTGKKIMDKFLSGVREDLLSVLEEDKTVKAGVFDSSFTRQAFVSFVLSNLLFSLSAGEKSSSTLLRVIRAVLY